MFKAPLVSILMNCFNGERYLKEAIDSIYAQTYQNWEIIFVDNCSVDTSAEIAKSYDERLKYYKTEKNIPLGAARNWGLQFVRGDFLAFLDTDDLWMPDKLSLQIDKMTQENSWMSFGSAEHINQNGNLISTNFVDEESKSFSSLLKKYTINMQSVLINLQKVPVTFDESLSYAPDYKLFMTIAAKSNGKITVISKPIVKYRVHLNSLSYKLSDIKYKETLKILEELNREFPKIFKKNIVEYQVAIMLSEEKKAEYFLSKGEYYKASITFYRIHKLSYKYLLKAIIFILPFFNQFFYNFLKDRRKKRLQ